MKKTRIIAEAGVNHNSELKIALDLVDSAKESGADCIKFQVFFAEELASKLTPKADYQRNNGLDDISHQEMLKSLELSFESLKKVYEHAKKINIDFLASAFDKGSLDFIINELKLPVLKIASGEITNGPLLLEHSRSSSKLILSTGMSNMDEIRTALSIIAFGLIADFDSEPKMQSFKDAFDSRDGQLALKEKVTLLHCTSEYPAPVEDLNLSAIRTIRDEFELDVGYSDHSQGIKAAPIAVAAGAKIIEKHLTLDRTMKGPDHTASLEPNEFKKMVKSIRLVESLMGDTLKAVQPSEAKNINVARKSIYASKNIKKGENFSSENISIKRPYAGNDPNDYWKLINRKSSRDFLQGELIDE